MNEIIDKKVIVNFFGFESIDLYGNHHYHLNVLRGTGELKLLENGIFFKQWKINNEIFIPYSKINNLEIAGSHNRKKMWPSKVLRIFYYDGNEIKIVGFAFGGKLSLTKGFQSHIDEWKELIQAHIGIR